MSSTDSYRSGFHGGRTCRKSKPVQVTSSWRSCCGDGTFDDVCHLGKINQKAKKKYSNETSNYIQYITQSWKVSARVRNVWTGASHQRKGKECQKCEEHNCLVMPESDTKNDEMCSELLQNQSHRVQKNAQDRRPSVWTEKHFAHRSQSELQKTTCLEGAIVYCSRHLALCPRIEGRPKAAIGCGAENFGKCCSLHLVPGFI